MNYCKNCGKVGHSFKQCKLPITSIGMIVIRLNPDLGTLPEQLEYLMICRKDTLGYIDFVRGNYSILDNLYIMRMFNQMTVDEKHRIQTLEFDDLWNNLWEHTANCLQYKSEKIKSKEKFTLLRNSNLNDLLTECKTKWTEPEWGFPKGRRDYQENDYTCALREFSEETGYDSTHLINIQNVLPFEEMFIGSNDKCYKHKYFLMFMNYTDTLNNLNFQKTEVSNMKWNTYNECIQLIRPYNVEKIKIMSDVYKTITRYDIMAHSL